MPLSDYYLNSPCKIPAEQSCFARLPRKTVGIKSIQPRGPWLDGVWSFQMSLCDFEATEEFLDLKPSTGKATVRRPKKDEPIQVLTEKAHKNLVLAERNSQFFLVGKKAQLLLKKQAKTYVLIPCITQNGELFFWPLLSSMAKTFKQLEEGKTGWLTISWSKSSRGYEVSPSTGRHDSPKWPSDNFEVAGEAAFDGRLIKEEGDSHFKLIQAAKKRPKPTS